MQIDTDTFHTIRSADYDQETGLFTILVVCGWEQLKSASIEPTEVEVELQDVARSAGRLARIKET